MGSSARADAVADAVAARLDARFAKLESVLAERSPGFDSREGEHAKIDTAHNERRAVKVARKELKSARRDARMELSWLDARESVSWQSCAQSSMRSVMPCSVKCRLPQWVPQFTSFPVFRLAPPQR